MTCTTPVRGRDLSSFELWETSLLRSQHRRQLADGVRRRRTRRRAGSIALSAAMLGPTAAPGLAAAVAGLSSQAATAGDTTVGDAASGAPLVAFGAQGPTVAAIQARLRATLPEILVDGIFGPQTEGAVRAYQRAHGLPVTGGVDARTWSALFRAGVVFYDGRSAGERSHDAAAGPAAPPAPVRFAVEGTGASVPATMPTPKPAAGGREATQTAEAPRPVSVARPVAAPRPAAPHPVRVSAPAPAPVPAPAPGGGGCGTGRLTTPVHGIVTGTFGEQRPGHMHAGVDLAVAQGTPVHAAQCGTVAFAGVEGGYGNLVCIRHAGGVTTCYAHLSGFATAAGRYVHAGDVIGYVGCTGSCTGPHLHFEVRQGSTPVDPMPYLRGTRTIAGGHAPVRTAAVAPRTRTTARVASVETTVGQTSTSSGSAGTATVTATPVAAAPSTASTSAYVATASPSPSPSAASTSTSTATPTPSTPVPTTTTNTSVATPAPSTPLATTTPPSAPVATTPTTPSAPVATSAPSTPVAATAPSNAAAPATAATPVSSGSAAGAVGSPPATPAASGTTASGTDASATPASSTTPATNGTGSAPAPAASSTPAPSAPAPSAPTPTAATTATPDTSSAAAPDASAVAEPVAPATSPAG